MIIDCIGTLKMRLYTNDLDNAIKDYTPKEADRISGYTIVKSEFKEDSMSSKGSKSLISPFALVDYYSNNETAELYNQSWLGISTRRSDDSSAPVSNYRFFGDVTVASFKKDMGVNSVDELVGKEILRIEQSNGQILGYSPSQ